MDNLVKAELLLYGAACFNQYVCELNRNKTVPSIEKLLNHVNAHISQDAFEYFDIDNIYEPDVLETRMKQILEPEPGGLIFVINLNRAADLLNFATKRIDYFLRYCRGIEL